MTTLRSFIFLLLWGVAFAAADETEYRYVRYVGDDKEGTLQTAVVTMEKDGVVLDLIGAVHIADADYYETLEKSFAGYDALLFELVDGQKISKKRQAAAGEIQSKISENEEPKEQEFEEDGEPEFATDVASLVLHDGMKKAGALLKLTFQIEKIDYLAPNFVHADVSMRRFQELQEEKGESWFVIFQKLMKADLQRSSKPPELRLGMLVAGFLGDPTALKVAMARQLQEVDHLEKVMGDQPGGSVLIGERNARALEVLDEQIALGKRKIGIFYGAAHLADFEERLSAKNWKRTGQRWNSAWNIRRPQKKGPK